MYLTYSVNVAMYYSLIIRIYIDKAVLAHVHSYRFIRNITEKDLNVVVKVSDRRHVGEHIRERVLWKWCKIFIINQRHVKVRITKLGRFTRISCGKLSQILSTSATFLITAAHSICAIFWSYLRVVHVSELMQSYNQDTLTVHQLYMNKEDDAR